MKKILVPSIIVALVLIIVLSMILMPKEEIKLAPYENLSLQMTERSCQAWQTQDKQLCTLTNDERQSLLDRYPGYKRFLDEWEEYCTESYCNTYSLLNNISDYCDINMSERLIKAMDNYQSGDAMEGICPSDDEECKAILFRDPTLCDVHKKESTDPLPRILLYRSHCRIFSSAPAGLNCTTISEDFIADLKAQS